MQNLLIAVNAVVPLLFYIAAGYIARAAGAAEPPFLKKVNGLVFHAFFPFIMFQNLYTVDFSDTRSAALVLFSLTSLLVVVAVLFLAVPRIVRADAKRGVIIQALFRSNTILFALPMMESVYGQAGVGLATRILAFMVPCYNIIAILVLEHYHGGKTSAGTLIRELVHNPLIIGALAGLLFALSPLKMPEFLAVPISKMAGIATPLALFCLGGTLEFTSMVRNLRYIVPVLVCKLIVIPAVLVGVMVALRFSPMETFAVFATYATPIATSSYPMAQEMGGDGELAGELVLCSTVVSGITLFFWIYLMKSVGVF